MYKSIFDIQDENIFQDVALQTFRYQAENVPIYSEYLKQLNCNPHKVKEIKEIPFLPIEFFKTHRICGKTSEEIIFTSSGTTGNTTSKHHVFDILLYEESFLRAFQLFYGQPTDYVFLGLLPSYQERGGSSLIYMVEKLMNISAKPENGFYLNNFPDLIENLRYLEQKKQKTILFGVTYSLLELVENYSFRLDNTIIMETGGMKGRRKEMIRQEVHEIITKKTGLKAIHSEYGMTELLSQAYSFGDGKFSCPPWMRIYIRDAYDPFSYLPKGRSGGINIIDLANKYSCSFLETKDLGTILDNNLFQILGRFDNSDIRGCNLLVQ